MTQPIPHVLAIGEALIDVMITHDQPEFPRGNPGWIPRERRADPRAARTAS